MELVVVVVVVVVSRVGVYNIRHVILSGVKVFD